MFFIWNEGENRGNNPLASTLYGPSLVDILTGMLKPRHKGKHFCQQNNLSFKITGVETLLLVYSLGDGRGVEKYFKFTPLNILQSEWLTLPLPVSPPPSPVPPPSDASTHSPYRKVA